MTATLVIESLKRLYQEKELTKEHLDQMLAQKKISEQEYKYIIS